MLRGNGDPRGDQQHRSFLPDGERTGVEYAVQRLPVISLRLLPPLLVAFAFTALPPAAFADLFVVSQGTKEVLAYDGATGAFDGVFAATITHGFRNPGGIAIRPSDGVLYVSSIAGGSIWSYTTATGIVTLPAATTAAIAPFGIGFDATGANLYFADATDSEQPNTDAIKELEIATGTVTILGTNNQVDLLGVAVNGSDVYATDVALSRVLRFPIGGGNESVEIASGLDAPEALLFLSATQMIVADTGNDRVVEYTESGGNWSFQQEIVPASAGVVEPSALAIAPDGRLTVAGRASGDVVLVDLGTLVVTPLVAPGAGGLADPKGVAWSGNTLLVSSGTRNAIFYYDVTGQPTGVRAEGVNSPLEAGLHFSPDGSRLFVASISGNDIVEFDMETGARVHLYNNVCPNAPLPFDSVIGPDGRLYISCTLNSSIQRYDPSTGASLGAFVIAGAGGLVNPRSLAFGPNGNLFVANGSGAIFEFDGVTGAAASPVTFVDTNGNGGGPLDASHLHFRGNSLYVTSPLYDEVVAFDATSGAYLSTFVSSGSGGLTGPKGLDFGPDGDLYVGSQYDDTVRRYDGATGSFVSAFVPAGLGGLDLPTDLAFQPSLAVPAVSRGGRAMVCCVILATSIVILRRRQVEPGARQ